MYDSPPDDQLRRLDRFVKRCEAQILRRRPDLKDEKYGEVKVLNAATALARIQLRHVGHLARHPEQSVPRRMMSADVDYTAHPGRQTVMLMGQNGRYNDLLKKHLTSAARGKFFGRCDMPTSGDGRPVRCSSAEFQVLAQHRDAWRKFANSVVVD